MRNHLAREFSEIGKRLRTIALTELPTPVSTHVLELDSSRYDILVKHDDRTGRRYGGNKVRKLEYILRRARDRGASRIATFGTVGSHHALATALYARETGFDCTCFLSHQSPRPGLASALLMHQRLDTEVVRFGGERRQRIATLRKYLHGRNAWVIPLGGSSWLGAVGYVNAGLEFAAQVRAGDVPEPGRIYVAFGTMATAAGLTLGLALAGLDVAVQAIRVTEPRYANEPAARRLMSKTATLLRAIDPAIPANLAATSRIECRNEFFGGGYGRTNAATDGAIAVAHEQLGLTLESTYTGKAMAALVHDLRIAGRGPVLFWNTYNSQPLDIDERTAPDFDRLPREFERYFN